MNQPTSSSVHFTAREERAIAALQRIFAEPKTSERHPEYKERPANGESLHKLVMGQAGYMGLKLIAGHLIALQKAPLTGIAEPKAKALNDRMSGCSEGLKKTYFSWLENQLASPQTLAAQDYAAAQKHSQRANLGVRNPRRRASDILGGSGPVSVVRGLKADCVAGHLDPRPDMGTR